jgi:DNA-directed RNA polymerase subunit F
MSEEISSMSVMKHINLFKKISDNSAAFLDEEIISLSELINLMTFFDINESGKNSNSQVDEVFRKYYKLYADGLTSGQLKLVNSVSKKNTPILSQVADIMGGTTEFIQVLVAKIYGATFDKIKTNDLNKCVKTCEAIIFTIKNKYDVPDFFIDFVVHHNPEAIKFETIKKGDEEIVLCRLIDEPDPVYSDQTSSNENRMGQEVKVAGQIPSLDCVTRGNDMPEIDKIEAIKQSRIEAGKKNGEKWRKFVAENIKTVVERELIDGCLCLHRVMAVRLKDELISEVRMSLGDKYYNKKKDILPQKIEDEIKNIFYRFDREYNKVRSRVLRGDHYNEYDYVPCPHHSGK